MGKLLTKAELEALPTRELAVLVGVKLLRGRPSRAQRDEMVVAAKAAKARAS